MGLEPKTSEELRALIRLLREEGVLSYSYSGVVLTLHPSAPEAGAPEREEAEKVSAVLGLTKAQQDDLFNEVVDPVA